MRTEVYRVHVQQRHRQPLKRLANRPTRKLKADQSQVVSANRLHLALQVVALVPPVRERWPGPWIGKEAMLTSAPCFHLLGYSWSCPQNSPRRELVSHSLATKKTRRIRCTGLGPRVSIFASQLSPVLPTHELVCIGVAREQLCLLPKLLEQLSYDPVHIARVVSQTGAMRPIHVP